MTELSIRELLEIVIKRDASDLHLVVGAMPTIRIDGKLIPIEDTPPLDPETSEKIIFSLLNNEQKEILIANKEIDFSFALGEVARFRVNCYHQKGYLCAALRYIPTHIRSMEELGIPKVVQRLTSLPQGFVLVTGPTGHGKSTTLAAMIEEINKTRQSHIITIEDPIEYVFSHRRGLVSQRELHLDTHSWEIALRSILREDPDVVLIGEMRDFETIAAALTIAETGHLVFATLHTNNAAQTIDRIIDVFPEHQQAQVQAQLANTIEGIVSQRLIPTIGGGRILASEVLFATPALRALIRDKKTHQINNFISTSSDLGMQSLEQSLAILVKAGKVSLEEATGHTLNVDDLMRIIKTKDRE